MRKLLVVVLLGLSGCGVRDAVLGEPLEAGPQIEALEARNPVVSDLELTSGERVEFRRYDGGEGGAFNLASDSGAPEGVNRFDEESRVYCVVTAPIPSGGWLIHT